ncbi:MAG: hypothetical protein ACREU8_10705, partial [Gammaproteobacteria bacterium]
ARFGLGADPLGAVGFGVSLGASAVAGTALGPRMASSEQTGIDPGRVGAPPTLDGVPGPGRSETERRVR